jgi:hypothetical protein
MLRIRLGRRLLLEIVVVAEHEVVLDRIGQELALELSRRGAARVVGDVGLVFVPALVSRIDPGRRLAGSDGGMAAAETSAAVGR